MTGEELFEEYKHLSFQEKLKFDNLFYVLVNNDLNAEHNRLDLIERRLSAAVALQNLTDETGGPFFDVKWYYANKVERMKIMFDALSEDDKREFLKKLAEDVKIKV